MHTARVAGVFDRLPARGSRYLIEVGNPACCDRGVLKAELDGVVLAIGPCRIPLHDDGGVHRVAIELGG